MLNTSGRNYSIILIGLLLLAELIINPIGEFPLNDDWAYSKVIAAYVHSGTLKFSDWQAIPFIPQFIAGISLTKLFGFSFTLLRFISLASLMAMVFVFNSILKELEIKPFIRFITQICFVFNPLTLSLSNTFLPDVFTILVTLIAFLYIIRLFKSWSNCDFILFVLFSLLASLNRQSSIVLPIAFGIVYCIKKKWSLREVMIGSTPAIISIIALILYEWIAIRTNSLPLNYRLQSGHIIHSISHPDFRMVKSFFYYFVTSTILLGLFLLPLTFSNLKDHFSGISKSVWAKTIAAIYCLLILFKIILSGHILPFVGNMFYPFGVGPVILTGFNTEDLQAVSLFSQVFCIILNFAGGVSFYMAFHSIICKVEESKNKESNIFIYFFFFIFFLYLIPICLSYANDRYLIYLLPFFLLAYILSFHLRVNKFWPALTLGLLMFFSVASTHDYVSINRARWKATDHLTRDLHISPKNIDGGFEFNGFYSSNFNKYDPSQTGRWWRIEDDTYIISPLMIKEYQVESEYEFSSLISFKFHKIYALKRMQKQ